MSMFILAYIRQIVAFFHRSNIAAALLKSKAELLTLPQHKLIIDVCTRWNSTHDMLQRFLEMQVAVFAVLRSKELSNDKKAFKSLTDDDITLAEDAVKLLKPLKDITLVLCSEKTPTVSYIMPLQHQLIDHLSTVSDEDSPTIREMKTSLTNDLQNRYSSQQDMLNLCSSLDPRFKLLPYLSEERRFQVYNALANELAKLHSQSAPVGCGTGSQTDQHSEHSMPVLPRLDIETSIQIPASSEGEGQPMPALCNTSVGEQSSVLPDLPGPCVKKMKREKSASLLDDIFGDIYLCGQEPPKSPRTLAEDEVKRYRNMPSIALSDCPLAWWKTHQMSLPILSRLAKQYLCIPGTSVPSERVFSTAGDILTAQRSALKSKNLDTLIFLKKNLD